MYMALRRTPQLRKLTRIVSACASLLLALVVVIDVARAGRSYIYCNAMQEVMEHSCCQQHHQASSSTPLLANAQRDCCQDRVVPALGAWTAFQQQTLVAAAPWFAIIARPLFDGFAALGLRLRPTLTLNRSGPALLRVLAQLMVFRL